MGGDTIKQGVVAARGKVEIREFEKPALDARDMMTRVIRAGVCGTDVHLVHSPQPFPWKEPSYPFLLGHEWAGVIDQMGDKFPRADAFGESISEGDRVVVYPSTWACGKCYTCKNLLHPNLCLRPPFPRKLPATMNAFSEYFYVPEGSAVYRVPDELESDAAVLTEPMAAALRAFERSFAPGVPDRFQGMGPGKSVVVLGTGTIGALITGLAKISGAHPIICIGGPPNRLEACKKLGADTTVEIDKVSSEQRIETVREMTPHGLGADVVIEAAGVPQAFIEGIEMTRPGGSLVEVGHYTDRGTIALNPLSICKKDIHIYGSWGYGPQEFGAALHILYSQRDVFRPQTIVTHHFSLDQLPEAVEVAREQTCLKAVIDPSL